MNSNFCNQPWKYRVINISQDWYKFCCVSPEIKVANVSTIENNDVLNSVKNNLLANVAPKECNYCFDLESTGVKSYRDIVADKNPLRITNGLAVIEINLENTCNLRCAMCGSRYSSRWESKNIEVVNSTKILENVEHTIDLIKQNKNTLQRIIISGGEPSIIPNFYKLIQHIKESLPTNAWIYINTNGMFNERLGERFLDTIKELSKTHNVLIYWSCDGKGSVGEFLRDGLDYQKFKENLKTLVEETSASHTLQITTTHLNLKSQIDLIQDIFETVQKISIKRLYPVISFGENSKQSLMHPNILGNKILKIISEPDLERLENLCPEYSKEFKSFVNGISKNRPDDEKIKKSYNWFKNYAESINKTMPVELEEHFKLLSAI